MKVLECIAVYPGKIFSHEPDPVPILKSSIVEMQRDDFPLNDKEKKAYEAGLCAGGKHWSHSATRGSVPPARIVLVALSIIPE